MVRRCRARIKCLSCIGKQGSPTQVARKHGHKFLIGKQEPNEETLSAPWELPRTSAVPRTHKTQKTTVIRGTDSSLLLTFLLRRLASTLAAAFCKALNPQRQVLNGPTGVKEFLEENKTHYITKDRMDRNFFSRRLDGQRHAWVHALEQMHCQYCRYVWANELDDA